MFKSMMSSIVSKTMSKKLISATITEEDIKALLSEIRISLLDADVNLMVVRQFINQIKEKTIGQTIDKKLSPSDFMINIIKNELIEILGKNESVIKFDKKLTKIMLVGLQGSGKTTTAGKIANYVQKKHDKKTMLVACDIYRPAAIDQLRTLALETKSNFYEKQKQDPVITVDQAIDKTKLTKDDVLIVDTAGRLQTNVELMDELKNIKSKLNPDEILLVVDSMSGQDIINVATEFHNNLKLTGIVITKLDSDARAGAVLSLVHLLNVPIKFTGIGEKLSALDLFYPERIADRILGLGDITTLAEKAVEVVDEKKAKGQMQRMLSGKMDLEDLMNQLQQMNKMGPLGGIVSMIPGLNNKISADKIDEMELQIKNWSILMSSMTKKERRNPKILKRELNRRNRIIKGSGRKPDELNKLLKRWEDGNKKMTEIGRMLKSGKNPFGSNMPF